MPPRRHKTGWPYVDPNPLGTLRQSRTAFYRLLPRLIRRPGAKDPDHEYVADTAVDRHHRDRRYAPAGLTEYLDAGVRRKVSASLSLASDALVLVVSEETGGISVVENGKITRNLDGEGLRRTMSGGLETPRPIGGFRPHLLGWRLSGPKP